MRSLLIGFLLIAPAAYPQAIPPNVVRDPQAIAILAQVYAAMGGASKERTADFMLEGTLSEPETGQSIGTFAAKARGFDISVDTVINAHSMSYKVLREIGASTLDGVTHRLAWHTTSGLTLDLIPIFARWTEFTNPLTAVRFLGQIQANGKSFYSIEIESPRDPDIRKQNDLGHMYVLVDQTTGLLASLRYQAAPAIFSSFRVMIETGYSDYRNQDGILTPGTIAKVLDGKPAEIMHVNRVQFNNGFGNSDFKN